MGISYPCNKDNLKVHLRDVEKSDIDVLYKWINDEELVKFNSVFRQVSWTEHKVWFKGILKGQQDRRFFMIIESYGSAPIGSCQLLNIDQSGGSCELQIRLGEWHYHGVGFGTEAVKLLVLYAFNVIGMRTIKLDVFKSNERAIKSYLKVGFDMDDMDTVSSTGEIGNPNLIRMRIRRDDK